MNEKVHEDIVSANYKFYITLGLDDEHIRILNILKPKYAKWLGQEAVNIQDIIRYLILTQDSFRG